METDRAADDVTSPRSYIHTADVHTPLNTIRPASAIIPRSRRENEEEEEEEEDIDEWYSANDLSESTELFYSTTSLRLSNPNIASTPLRTFRKKKYSMQSMSSMYFSMDVIEEHRESISDDDGTPPFLNTIDTTPDGPLSPVSVDTVDDSDHDSENSDFYEVMFSLLSTADLTKVPYSSSRKSRTRKKDFSKDTTTPVNRPQIVRMISSAPIVQSVRAKVFSVCAAIFPNLMTFGAIAFYLFDIGSDVRLAFFYLSENNLTYGVLTLFFVMLPAFCIAVYIMIGPHPYSEIGNGKRRLYKKMIGILQAIFLLRPIVTELKVWRLVMEEASESESVHSEDAEININNVTSMSNLQVNAIFRARKEAKLWGMMSSVLEDAPQLILQVAIFIQQSEHDPAKLNARLIAILFSLVGITRLVTFYDIGLAPTNLRDISKVLLVLTYHLFVISSRVTAMSLVAAVRPITMGVWMAGHWLLMVALTKKFSIVGHFRRHWPDLLMASYHMIATTTRLSVFSTRNKMQVVQLFYIFVIENTVIFIWVLIGTPPYKISTFLANVGIAFMVLAAIFLFLCLHFDIFEWLPKSAPGAQSIRSLKNHGYFETLGQTHNRDLIPYYIAFY